MRALLLVAAAGLAIAGIAFAYRAGTIFWAQYRDFIPARHGEANKAGARDNALLPPRYFSLQDGTRVATTQLASRNGAVVVFVHGSPGDRGSFLPTALALSKAGYGALLLDLPGHGESEGRADWGSQTEEAIARSIAMVLEWPGVRHVALFGYSMGSFPAAAAATDRRVGALVLLAPFTDLADQLRYQFRSRVPFASEFAVLAARMAGVPVDRMRTLDAVRSANPRPLMIIAGDRDHAVPLSMPRALFDAAPDPKLLWIVPGAGHVDVMAVAGEGTFSERLRGFLDQAFFPIRAG